MHDYKIKALLDLATPFREAGRAFGEAVFAAGIGNRLHDAVAYKAAGIPEDFIFLIDPESNLRVSLTFIYIYDVHRYRLRFCFPFFLFVGV